jgi:hypothetical protein
MLYRLWLRLLLALAIWLVLIVIASLLGILR